MTSSFPSKYMSTSEEFPIHFHGWLRINKDGRCERFIGNDIVPAGVDLFTGVHSKDVLISRESNVFVRIYIPKTIRKRKLPTFIYYHGGGFLIESASSSTYHPTLNLITQESNVIAVSVNYRLAPEHLIPTAYEDSWEAIKWVDTHANGNGPESWLNDYADLENVYFAGDSAGANIAHNMAIRVGLSPVKFINLKGVILIHPYFGGKDPIGVEDKTKKHQHHKAFMDQMWLLANKSGVGLDDPLYNPAMDPRISDFGSLKILVCVGEKDKLKCRGLNYKKVIEKSGWKGKVVVMESKGEGHVFFLSNVSSENARILRTRICMFINPIRSKS
ncbi:alpha/Beta hydrolase fold protein [Artemisia annua]|uniref:Alpha/Beta hydrolase fold protein n=1 Tax=Artemisia annua TaxID=35608 RepID=A0A2U1KPV4_ARTAN|nr:alpha/Beta hydrolase fold protein [Artemisia annua]